MTYFCTCEYAHQFVILWRRAQSAFHIQHDCCWDRLTVQLLARLSPTVPLLLQPPQMQAVA